MVDQATVTRPISVVIVDDHELVRRGLKGAFGAHDDIELVGEARDGETAVAMCAAKQPDVVLMDLIMPGMDGAQATESLLRRSPSTRVLALTSFTDPELVQRTLKAGAIGYLLKSVTGDELAAAVRRAAGGKSTLAPEAAQVLVEAAQTPEDTGPLTAREREVLSLLTHGFSNAEIAARLFVSLSTAKAHVSSIISKLGAASRTEAATIGLREKLV
jgi:two-component system, NarL family, response regulator LiaR